jgi:hypothetical protein
MVLTGVEMRELAAYEESLCGPAGRPSIEQHCPGPGDRDPGGPLANPWECEHALRQPAPNAFARGLLVNL